MNYALCIKLIDYLCDVGIKKEEKVLNSCQKIGSTIGYDKEKSQYYYRFYEVGTSYNSKGASEKNKLYIDKTNHLIVGTTAYIEEITNVPSYYTITEVRKNIGEEY